MLRFFIGAMLVALIAILIGWRWYGQERAIQDSQAAQISDLGAQVGKLASDNARLNAELSKVQEEETRLTKDNDALRESIEKAKLTSKVPPPKSGGTSLPYPPK
ncbi:MAG: hypothetical protein ACHQZS_08280 [Candidatus Binatales bacterium]